MNGPTWWCHGHKWTDFPPAIRSELFCPFQPSIDSPWTVTLRGSPFKGNRRFREPGYSSHQVAGGTHAQAPGSDRAMMQRRMRVTDPNRRATCTRASPLAAGATSKDSDSRDRFTGRKDSDSRDGTGWDAHSKPRLARPPGAAPPAGSGTRSHEQDQSPGDGASQPGNAQSARCHARC